MVIDYASSLHCFLRNDTGSVQAAAPHAEHAEHAELNCIVMHLDLAASERENCEELREEEEEPPDQEQKSRVAPLTRRRMDD